MVSLKNLSEEIQLLCQQYLNVGKGRMAQEPEFVEQTEEIAEKLISLGYKEKKIEELVDQIVLQLRSRIIRLVREERQLEDKEKEYLEQVEILREELNKSKTGNEADGLWGRTKARKAVEKMETLADEKVDFIGVINKVNETLLGLLALLRKEQK